MAVHQITNAEILKTPPESGLYSESHFGEHFNFRVWVKFTVGSDEWAGCFAKPYDGIKSSVLIDQLGTTAFIIAGGCGYLVDLINRTLILALHEHPAIESAIRTTNPDYFVAGTFYSFYLIESSGTVKEHKPDYLIDGIYLEGQRGTKVYGKLATAYNQYEKNVDFEFDLSNFQLSVAT